MDSSTHKKLKYMEDIKKQMDMHIIQKQLFDEIIALKQRIQALTGYVQNDFNILLTDDMICKAQILESITDCEKDYLDTIEKLNDYKQRTIEILKHYSK